MCVRGENARIENDKVVPPGQAKDKEKGGDGDDDDGVEEEAEHDLFSSHLCRSKLKCWIFLMRHKSTHAYLEA